MSLKPLTQPIKITKVNNTGPADNANTKVPNEPLYLDPSDRAFKKFSSIVYSKTGNKLEPHKKALLSARLNKRIRALKFSSYDDYLKYLLAPENKSEIHEVIDALTTNETHFFREPKHFDFLAEIASKPRPAPLRIWSAACSSGQEPYSIAMKLENTGHRNWKICASDINRHVLESAKVGRYDLKLSKEIPSDMLKKYCMKGINEEQGFFRIQRRLRERIDFKEINLNAAIPNIGQFDIIFLRNILIYFSKSDCNKIVQRTSKHLVPGGYLLVGHSESLRDSKNYLESVAPTIYRRLERGKFL